MIGGLCHFDFAIEERRRQGDTERAGGDDAVRSVGSHLVIVYSVHRHVNELKLTITNVLVQQIPGDPS